MKTNQKRLFELEQLKNLSRAKLLEMLELQEQLQKEVENAGHKNLRNNEAGVGSHEEIN